MRALFALFLLSGGLLADNEIFIDQTGDNAVIDIEQLGSNNIIGGTDAVAGSMTKAILNGQSWTLDLNQIGDSNKFLTDGIFGDNFTGYFDFTGDSNEWEISIDSSNLNGADYLNMDIEVVGSSNTADLDFGEDSDVSNLELDWIITGDSLSLIHI